MKPVWTADGYILFWTAPKAKDEMDRAVQYVVYRFDNKEKVNLNDPSHIVAITNDTFYKLPYENGKTKYRYVVTALDRLHNESKAVKKKLNYKIDFHVRTRSDNGWVLFYVKWFVIASVLSFKICYSKRFV